MEIVPINEILRSRIEEDPILSVCDINDFLSRYDDINQRFHAYFPNEIRENFIENARYHKHRYCELLKEPQSGMVLDVGNDKPFLSYYLSALNSTATIKTISYGVQDSPVEVHVLDIELESFPFELNSMDKVLFVEVLEHLWRDPAKAIYEINRVLKIGGELYLTTPNPCELHALTCILWQANPNQRNQFYRILESGHLHLWSSSDLRILLEGSGFTIQTITSFDAYKYTEHHAEIWEFVSRISPYTDLMGESLLVRATKNFTLDSPAYPKELFPDGKPVQLEGTLKNFLKSKLLTML